jgi:hypothetical protein
MNASNGFGSIEMTGLISELRAQAWECELTSDGSQWKAKPPDNRRLCIKFRAMHGDFQGILRQLRDHGFKWPPPDKRKPDPVIRATPFAPKPHPHVEVETETLIVDAVRPRISEAPPPASPTTSEATAYAALREAKEYERLAASEMRAARENRDAAEQLYGVAKATYDAAHKDLLHKKRAFDEAFGAEQET